MLANIREFVEICKRQCDDMHRLAREPTLVGGSAHATFAVDRRRASELSLEQFFLEYAMPRRPVVLVGGDGIAATGDALSFDRLDALLGSTTMLPLQRPHAQSTRWARLESAASAPAAQFLRDVARGVEQRYLFDWFVGRRRCTLNLYLKCVFFFCWYVVGHCRCLRHKLPRSLRRPLSLPTIFYIN